MAVSTHHQTQETHRLLVPGVSKVPRCQDPEVGRKALSDGLPKGVRRSTSQGFGTALPRSSPALQCVSGVTAPRPLSASPFGNTAPCWVNQQQPRSSPQVTVEGPLVVAQPRHIPSGQLSPLCPRRVMIEGQLSQVPQLPSGSTEGMATSSSYYLEVVRGVDLNIDTLSAERRRLPLAFTAGGTVSSSTSVSVGRNHQPDLFEAWLSNERLRNCISRTAFEIISGSHGLILMVRGTSPVSVNGRAIAQNVGVTLSPGSEIGFDYNPPGVQGPFLLLRIMLRGYDLQIDSNCAGPVSVSQSVQRFPSSSVSSLVMEKAQVLVEQAVVVGPIEDSCTWSLECIHAEGTSAKDLAALPPDLRRFELPIGVTIVGRDQQRLFETLLAGASSFLTFISRAHVEITVHPDKGFISLTNVSANPVYMDRQPVAKGERCTLAPNQILSFARPEGPEDSIKHVHFLVLQVQVSASTSSSAAKCIEGEHCKKSPMSSDTSGHNCQVRVDRVRQAATEFPAAVSFGESKIVPAPPQLPAEVATTDTDVFVRPAPDSSPALLQVATVSPAIPTVRNMLEASLSPHSWDAMQTTHSNTSALGVAEPSPPTCRVSDTDTTVVAGEGFTQSPSSNVQTTLASSQATLTAQPLLCPSPDLEGNAIPPSAPRDTAVAPRPSLLPPTALMLGGSPSNHHSTRASSASIHTVPCSAQWSSDVEPQNEGRVQLPTGAAPALDVYPLETQAAFAEVASPLPVTHSRGAISHAMATTLASDSWQRQLNDAVERSNVASAIEQQDTGTLKNQDLVQQSLSERLEEISGTSAWPAEDRQITAVTDGCAMIILELSGEGVLDVPSSQRRIGPVSLADRPLVIGRRHQPDLHRCAVKKDCLQFLSRDHFGISLEGSEFLLHALTPNPIYRFRDGESPAELATGDHTDLLPGDKIALGTGCDDVFASADDARRRLTWHFMWAGESSEHEVSTAHPQTRSAKNLPTDPWQREPSSPGGLGPRVSTGPWGSPAEQDYAGRSEPTSARCLNIGPAEHQWDIQSLGARDHQHREERPSELWCPSPRLLGASAGDPHMVKVNRVERADAFMKVDLPKSLPCFGGNTSLALDNLFEHALEDSSPRFGGSGICEVRDGSKDEYLRSLEVTRKTDITQDAMFQCLSPRHPETRLRR